MAIFLISLLWVYRFFDFLPVYDLYFFTYKLHKPRISTLLRTHGQAPCLASSKSSNVSQPILRDTRGQSTSVLWLRSRARASGLELYSGISQPYSLVCGKSLNCAGVSKPNKLLSGFRLSSPAPGCEVLSSMTSMFRAIWFRKLSNEIEYDTSESTFASINQANPFVTLRNIASTCVAPSRAMAFS